MSPGRGGRDIMRSIRWSEAEWRRVRFEARRHGLCPATYVRRATLGEIDSPPPPPRAPRAQRTRFQAARSGSLTIRVHDEELGRIRRMAEVLGMPVATFVRDAAVGYQIASRADAETIRHLAKIGVNLNQLTRHVHRTGRIGRELVELLAQLRGVLDSLA